MQSGSNLIHNVNLYHIRNNLFQSKEKPLGIADFNQVEKISDRLAQHYHSEVPSSKKLNFSFSDQYGVGGCSLWGKKETNEDFFDGSKLNRNVSQFTDKQWQEVINTAFENVQEQILKLPESKKQGASVCCAIVIGKRLILANLGNSEALNVTIKKEFSNNSKTPILQATTTSLNPRHHITNPKEKARLERLGSISLLGELLVTRSFGYSKYLVSHEPEIFFHELEDTAYLILASNGLRRGFKSYVGEIYERKFNILIAEEIKKYYQQYFFTETMAKELARLSYENGSGDNISVVVMPVTNIIPQTEVEPLVYLVGDGNRGNVVSRAVAECFIPTLQKEIAKKLSLNANKFFTPAIIQNTNIDGNVDELSEHVKNNYSVSSI